MKKSYHSNTVPAADAVTTHPMRVFSGARPTCSAVAMAVSPPASASGGEGLRQGKRDLGRARQGFDALGELPAIGFGDLAGHQHLGAIEDEGMQDDVGCFAVVR